MWSSSLFYHLKNEGVRVIRLLGLNAVYLSLSHRSEHTDEILWVYFIIAIPASQGVHCLGRAGVTETYILLRILHRCRNRYTGIVLEVVNKVAWPPSMMKLQIGISTHGWRRLRVDNNDLHRIWACLLTAKRSLLVFLILWGGKTSSRHFQVIFSWLQVACDSYFIWNCFLHRQFFSCASQLILYW